MCFVYVAALHTGHEVSFPSQSIGCVRVWVCDTYPSDASAQKEHTDGQVY